MTSATGRLLHWTDPLKTRGRPEDRPGFPSWRARPWEKEKRCKCLQRARLKEDLSDCKPPPRQGFSRMITGGYGIPIAPLNVRPKILPGMIGGEFCIRARLGV